MKKLVQIISAFLSVAIVTTSIISCGNQTNDNYTATQNQTVSTEQVKVSEEKINSNPIDRFVGCYTIYKGYDEQAYKKIELGVLPDGRVTENILAYISDGVHKKYLGDIVIISDDAFVVDAKSSTTVGCDGTPEFVFRNGQESEVAWSGGGIYLRRLVFDVKEMRAYIGGVNEYKSRDIAEVYYLKLKH